MDIIGIDLGGTNVRVGMVSDSLLSRVESLPIDSSGDENIVLNEICSLIEKFDLSKVEGIGMGVPSVVDTERGIVYDVQNIPSWKEVHVKEKLTSKFGIPVYINNDANCFAAGEKYFGKAKGYRDAVGLVIGTGIGAGLVINNKLYSGKNCGAGEVGMLAFRDGIIEDYCSGQFFVNKAGVNGKILCERAVSGDAAALEHFREFGRNIGEAVKILLYTIDPEIIVIGGSVSNSYKFFAPSMFESIESFAYKKTKENIKIDVSDTLQVAILGAAALYVDDIQK
jgi:glucokinase